MSEILAASGQIDVSPDHPVILSGNSFPEQPIAKVEDTIEWQAVRIQSNNQNYYLISGDFLSAGLEMRRAACDALPTVPPENIFVTATHCHSAPAIDPLLPVLGVADANYLQYAAMCLRDLLQKLAAAQLESVTLKTGQSTLDAHVYRRRKVWRVKPPYRQIAMIPDECVAVSDAVHLLRLERADGSALAIIWNWACHPTCYPDRKVISADFPGVVRRALRKEDSNLPVLFLQGFTGDIRPNLYVSPRGLKGTLKRLLYGKIFGPIPRPEWQRWADRIAGLVKELSAQVESASAYENLDFVASRHDISISNLQDISVEDRPLTIQTLEIGQILRIVALSCEPVDELRRHFETTGKQTICVGYLDHIFGYLPTDRQIAEGGYEVHGFRHNFSLPGNYYHDAEVRLTRLVKSYLARSRRS